MRWAGPAEEIESTCEETAPEGAGRPLVRSRHWRALERSRHWRALARSRYWRGVTPLEMVELFVSRRISGRGVKDFPEMSGETI